MQVGTKRFQGGYYEGTTNFGFSEKLRAGGSSQTTKQKRDEIERTAGRVKRKKGKFMGRNT